MRISIALVLFLSASTCFATEVAGVFSGKICGDTLCINGHQSSGRAVTILSQVRERTCTAETGREYQAKDDTLDFAATKLTKLKDCDVAREPFLVVFDEKPKYGLPKGEPLAQEDAEALDAKVKASRAFNEFYDDKSIPKFKLARIKTFKPKGLRFKLHDGKELDIIWHRVPGGIGEGAYFAVYKNKISPVSGLFTIKAPIVFTLGDRVLVHSTKSCLKGCGQVINDVFEWSDGGFKKIYSNGDFST